MGLDFCSGVCSQAFGGVYWFTLAIWVFPAGSSLSLKKSQLWSSLVIQNVYWPVAGGWMQPEIRSQYRSPPLGGLWNRSSMEDSAGLSGKPLALAIWFRVVPLKLFHFSYSIEPFCGGACM